MKPDARDRVGNLTGFSIYNDCKVT